MEREKKNNLIKLEIVLILRIVNSTLRNYN